MTNLHAFHHIDTNILYESNDTLRLEGKEYINLSITSPNKSLFNTFEVRKKEDPTINWCIIKLNPLLLCDSNLQCLFSVTNAANSSARNNYGHGNDANSFKKMFSDKLIIKNSYSTQEHTRIGKQDNETTDNQAEILIKGKIPKKYIKAICFSTKQGKVQTSTAWKYFGLDSSKFVVDEEIFKV